MKLRFILFLFYFSFILPTFGQNKIKWSSSDQISDRVQKGNKKFIVYFYYEGCKWCKHLEDQTFDNDNVAKFINQNFDAFKINAQTENKITIGDRTYTSVRIGKFDFSELAAELLMGDMSFPAIVFMDEKFNKIQSHSGFLDQKSFEMLLSYFAGNHHKNTLFKRYVNSYCKESHFNSLVSDKN